MYQNPESIIWKLDKKRSSLNLLECIVVVSFSCLCIVSLFNHSIEYILPVAPLLLSRCLIIVKLAPYILRLIKNSIKSGMRIYMCGQLVNRTLCSFLSFLLSILS